jgi:hypothetical protein
MMVKAEDLSVGDTMVLPFNENVVITDLGPVGPRTRFVRFRTANGVRGRIERGREVTVLAKVPDESVGS